MTLVLSITVVGALGFLLLSRVTTGLLEAKERSAVSEASAGLGEAQRLLDAANTGPSTPSPSRLVDTVVTSLATRAGSPATFDVLLLSTLPDIGAPERGTNLVAVSSIPPELRDAVTQDRRQSWTFSEIRFLDGRSSPGFVVGAPLSIPTVGPYELYYLFPLSQEQQTLDLVSSSILTTGIVLVGLLGAVAWIVTRQVVVPVRAAAKTAERLSSGNLDERLPIRRDDDLDQLARSFNAMAESIDAQITQLEELSRVQQRFVSDVSHELRTPLTTIRMAADVLFESRQSLTAETARSTELLQNQLDRFEALLSDLLEISRFDAGAAKLASDSVDVATLVQHVIDGTEPLAQSHNLRVRFASYERPCNVVCDARRIERIIRNLVDNAVEHGNEKGVLVELAGDDDVVSFTVRDFGVGMRPGEASLVFNRFWRADPARARTTGGTGLGLAIALEDAHLHGGWLEAWGEPGIGACFRLTLPRVAGAAVTHAVLPLSDEVSDDEESSDATRDESVSSREHSSDHPRGSGPSDPPSADSLVFTVPIDGEGGSGR
ncbi:MAG: HAMP domain-containing histidine kinase [Actinomycetia bacterium]|nr:HAMP domain-containing histidine kinase [Actinomycetes bacterium]MCH9850994.1 HAMP domain-containing histidine kinase [Actinomycetes bacterium]